MNYEFLFLQVSLLNGGCLLIEQRPLLMVVNSCSGFTNSLVARLVNLVMASFSLGVACMHALLLPRSNADWMASFLCLQRPSHLKRYEDGCLVQTGMISEWCEFVSSALIDSAKWVRGPAIYCGTQFKLPDKETVVLMWRCLCLPIWLEAISCLSFPFSLPMISCWMCWLQ